MALKLVARCYGLNKLSIILEMKIGTVVNQLVADILGILLPSTRIDSDSKGNNSALRSTTISCTSICTNSR